MCVRVCVLIGGRSRFSTYVCVVCVCVCVCVCAHMCVCWGGWTASARTPFLTETHTHTHTHIHTHTHTDTHTQTLTDSRTLHARTSVVRGQPSIYVYRLYRQSAREAQCCSNSSSISTVFCAVCSLDRQPLLFSSPSLGTERKCSKLCFKPHRGYVVIACQLLDCVSRHEIGHVYLRKSWSGGGRGGEGRAGCHTVTFPPSLCLCVSVCFCAEFCA